jgi:hypothetical protein
VRRLGQIKYKAERIQIEAIQLSQESRDAKLSELQDTVEQEWRLLCLRAGLVHPRPIPPLPGNGRNLLLSTAEAYNDMVVAFGRGTLDSPSGQPLQVTRPMSPILPLPDSLANHSVSGTNIGGFGAPVSSRALRPADSALMPELNINQPHIILPDPALPICVASFEMGSRYVLKLQHWRFDTVGAGRILRWIGTRPGHVLEHYLPLDVIPYTKHTSLRATEKELTLNIPGSTRVKWTKDGKEKMNSDVENATYTFVQLSDLNRFQEGLRDKDLIGVYDFDKIRSHRSSSYGEAGNQDLKLWLSRDDDDTFSISFFANHIREHLEFPLHWFSADLESSREKQTVQLNFKRQSGGRTTLPFLKKSGSSKSQGWT